MMTEERRSQLADRCEKHITWLMTLTPEAMTVCNSVKEQLDIYGIALAAFTQPASPALKLPDAKPDHDSEDGNDIDYLEPSQVYALGVDDGFNRCLREVVTLNAPHTAPIQPICATGGAEWVKCSERMPDEEGNDGLLLVCCGGVVKAGFYDHWDKFSDGEGYSFFSEVTHWMPLPSAPEEK